MSFLWEHIGSQRKILADLRNYFFEEQSNLRNASLLDDTKEITPQVFLGQQKYSTDLRIGCIWFQYAEMYKMLNIAKFQDSRD